MTIDQFTKKEFESYLEQHKPYEPLGLIQNEYCYKIVLDGQVSIMIRSSINADGVAGDTGKNSIRLWLVDNHLKPIGSKIDKWTTRIDGWQSRLDDKIYQLAVMRSKAGDCYECQKPFGIYKTEIKRILDGPKNVRLAEVKKSKRLKKFEGFHSLTVDTVTNWLKDLLKNGEDEFFVKCNPCSTRTRTGVNGNLTNDGRFSAASRQEIDISTKPLETAKTPDDAETGDLGTFLANPFGDEEETKNQPASNGFTPSSYQKVIFDFVQNGRGHGVVIGVAGCGKTTTNIEALKLIPRTLKTKYAAFNKHVERDISAKAPRYVNVSTFHSWGLANIRRNNSKIKIDKWKLHNLVDSNSREKLSYDNKNAIAKIIGLLKGQLLKPTNDNILAVSIAFNVEIADNYYSLIRTVFQKSIKDFSRIDFDDMVYYSAAGLVNCEKFDYIFVDEAQDMNLGQYQLVKNSLAANGRMLLIGDPNQSIYAFRGAHVGIMAEMAQEMDATIMPLPVSYRAPLAIVKHVNDNYNHIRFEAAENAKKGSVRWVDENDLLDSVTANDAVLCRTNAPLVAPCFSLIRSGIKATILGRDIGQGLIKLIEKREILKRVNDLSELLQSVKTYCYNEINKALDLKQETRAQLLEDQIDTIYALSADCETIYDLKQKCKSVFSDNANGVTFSSIHKAKGLEWQKVYVIGQKGNHKMGDPEQETNIRYVRDTRALDELIFVDD